MALTGDGGDELFAGYDCFRAARLVQRYQRVPQPLHRALAALARRRPQSTGYADIGRRALRFVDAARRPLPEQYLGWVGIMSPELARKLLIPTGGDPLSHFEHYFRVAASADPDSVPALLDVNLRSYLPDDLLIKAGRMSMAASLEARSPFLDHVLVEFTAGLPASLKLRVGVGKYILKQAFAGLLLPEIIHRRKHGCGVPVGNGSAPPCATTGTTRPSRPGRRRAASGGRKLCDKWLPNTSPANATTATCCGPC